MGFDGLIVTDNMEMRGVWGRWDADTLTRRAVDAGCDLFIGGGGGLDGRHPQTEIQFELMETLAARVGRSMRAVLCVDGALIGGVGVVAEAAQDRPRLDQRHGDAAAREFQSQGVGEPLQRELAGHVGAAIGQGDEAEHGAVLHDAPVPRARMSGMTRQVRSCQPNRLVSNWARSTSRVRSSTAPG
jgi:hypothetical protein